MEVRFKLSESEFELFYTYMYGSTKAVGNFENPFPELAEKIFKQITPQAKRYFGFEYERIVKNCQELGDKLNEHNIILLPAQKGSTGKN